MPAAPKQPVVEAERLYPNLEEYLETHDRADAEALYTEIKQQLHGLSRGAKARAAAKALSGIEATEGLLRYLFEVKEQLEEQARSKKSPRK